MKKRRVAMAIIRDKQEGHEERKKERRNEREREGDTCNHSFFAMVAMSENP